MTKFAPQPLVTPFRMGDWLLPNRVVMAPLTRQRAANSEHVPTKLQAQSYAQRASAGVIISEGTAISPQGYGWADTPGLWSAKTFGSIANIEEQVCKRWQEPLRRCSCWKTFLNLGWLFGPQISPNSVTERQHQNAEMHIGS